MLHLTLLTPRAHPHQRSRLNACGRLSEDVISSCVGANPSPGTLDNSCATQIIYAAGAIVGWFAFGDASLGARAHLHFECSPARPKAFFWLLTRAGRRPLGRRNWLQQQINRSYALMLETGTLNLFLELSGSGRLLSDEKCFRHWIERRRGFLLFVI